MRIASPYTDEYRLDLPALPPFSCPLGLAVKIALQTLLHPALDSFELEVVPPDAERHEGLDLREGGGAADIDSRDAGKW